MESLMPKQTTEQRDPVLWEAAQKAFENAYAGCYVPVQTEKRETNRAYHKLKALQKKKTPPAK